MDVCEQLQMLTGKHLPDRYKIINKIVQSALNFEPEQQLNILESFEPKDNIEKKLWVKLLTKFELPDVFLQTLKSEDQELIEILLSDAKWFFTKHQLKCDEILQNVFPNISTSVRCKFLHCLYQYYGDKDLNDIFLAVRDQYNLKWALRLLPKCSSEFVLTILTEENMCVSEKLLMKIYHVQPDTAVDYLKYLLNHDLQINSYTSVIQTLARFQPNAFFDLYDNTNVIQVPRLGAGTTATLIKTNKKFILDKPEHYVKILHQRQVHASLDYADYKKFYLGLSPKDEDEFVKQFNRRGRAHSLLQYMKKNKLEFLMDVYKTLFERDLLDNMSLYTETLMDILPLDLKAKCALKVIENLQTLHRGWEKWYCYISPDVALPKFKEFIFIATEADDRHTYIQYMIKCCGINEDLDSLFKVLQYINERHRNEDAIFRNSVLNQIADNFDLKIIPGDIWILIDEIIALINFGDEWNSVACGHCKKIIAERIRYNLVHDLPIKQHIGYILEVHRASHTYSFNILTDNQGFEKTCIESIINLLPETIFFDAFDHSLKILATIRNYNERYPGDKMSVINYTWVKHQIILMIKSNRPNFVDLDFSHDLEAYKYFKAMMPPEKLEVKVYNLHKFIKKPDVILQYIEQILGDGLEFSTKSFLRFVRMRKFIYIPKVRSQIIQYCLDNFHTAPAPKTRANALKILAHLVDAKTFYQLSTPYFPLEKKLDIKNTDLITYAVQQAIGGCIKNYYKYQDSFPALLVFCRGDFLKLTIGSLTSVCLKTNQNKALTFLNDNFDQPVSVKKHFIRLINAVGPKENILKLLKNLWLVEKNPSIRNVIITSVFNWFANDPDADIWALLKSIFLDLTIKDRDIFSMLLSFQEVSGLYLEEHIKLCWETAVQLEQREKIILDHEKQTILQRITNNITKFDKDFLNSIVAISFKTTNSVGMQTKMLEFVAKYVLVANLDLQEKLDNVKRVFGAYVDLNWYTRDVKEYFVYPCRKTVFKFLLQLIHKAVPLKQVDTTLPNFVACQNMILNILKPAQIYKQYIELELAQLYLKSTNTNHFIDLLKPQFLDIQLQQFGPEVVLHLPYAIATFFKVFEADSCSKCCMLVVEKLLSNKPSVHDEIVAIKLMQKSLETKSMYDDLVKKLEGSSNVAVQVFLNEHFNL